MRLLFLVWLMKYFIDRLHFCNRNLSLSSTFEELNQPCLSFPAGRRNSPDFPSGPSDLPVLGLRGDFARKRDWWASNFTAMGDNFRLYCPEHALGLLIVMPALQKQKCQLGGNSPGFSLSTIWPCPLGGFVTTRQRPWQWDHVPESWELNPFIVSPMSQKALLNVGLEQQSQ